MIYLYTLAHFIFFTTLALHLKLGYALTSTCKIKIKYSRIYNYYGTCAINCETMNISALCIHTALINYPSPLTVLLGHRQSAMLI